MKIRDAIRYKHGVLRRGDQCAYLGDVCTFLGGVWIDGKWEYQLINENNGRMYSTADLHSIYCHQQQAPALEGQTQLC